MMKITALSIKNVTKTLLVLPAIVLVSTLTPACGQTSKGAERNSVSENPQGKLKTVTIPVKGMSCSSCVSNVKKNVKAMAGVEQVAVSLEKREATVTYAADTVSPEKLVQKINKLGYEAGKPVETNKQ